MVIEISGIEGFQSSRHRPKFSHNFFDIALNLRTNILVLFHLMIRQRSKEKFFLEFEQFFWSNLHKFETFVRHVDLSKYVYKGYFNISKIEKQNG